MWQKMDRLKYIVSFLFMSLAMSNTMAASDNDFETGVAYFKQQQYQQALNSFSSAYQQGLKTPALFHNLAVCHFKLGNYTQAEEFFKLASQYPSQKMMAEYNLGLVAKKRGQTSLANKHFTLVKNTAKDPKLVTLARIQLGEVVVTEPEKRWSVYGILSYGHDDNITIVPDSLPSKKASAYKK